MFRFAKANLTADQEKELQLNLFNGIVHSSSSDKKVEVTFVTDKGIQFVRSFITAKTANQLVLSNECIPIESLVSVRLLQVGI